MDKLTSYIELTIPLPQSIPSTMIEEIIQKILTDICTTVPDYSYEIEMIFVKYIILIIQMKNKKVIKLL